jgi:hypothetical protein
MAWSCSPRACGRATTFTPASSWLMSQLREPTWPRMPPRNGRVRRQSQPLRPQYLQKETTFFHRHFASHVDSTHRSLLRLLVRGGSAHVIDDPVAGVVRKAFRELSCQKRMLCFIYAPHVVRFGPHEWWSRQGVTLVRMYARAICGSACGENYSCAHAMTSDLGVRSSAFRMSMPLQINILKHARPAIAGLRVGHATEL